MAVTLPEYLAEQRELERQAATIFAGKIDSCTHSQGYLRQPLWLCLEHKAALCYACSVECHVKCERIIDLGVRRHFQCDCAGQECTLKQGEISVGEENRYQGHNFEGRFCVCDSELFDDTMLQCWACEDWFHTRCLNVEVQDEECEYFCPSCTLALRATPHFNALKPFGEGCLVTDPKPCECEECKPVYLSIHPHIYMVDPTFTPEPDEQIPDDLYERGMDHLLRASQSSLPVREALIRFNEVKTSLTKYLLALNKPVIEEEDIRRFFAIP